MQRAANIFLAAVFFASACSDSKPRDKRGLPVDEHSGKDSKANTSQGDTKEEMLTEVELEGRYRRAKRELSQVDNAATWSPSQYQEIKDLLQPVSGAKDPYLRANASMLLGRISEERGDPRSAASYYRAASQSIPSEPEPHAVLALALAASGRMDEAITEQRKLIKMVPDDLQARLILGELNVKAGHKGAATQAYAEYEVRRKGLIDGLTLQTPDRQYVMKPKGRIDCALALEPAVDNGTAMALLAALTTDPSPDVRLEISGVMGRQGLLGYEKTLQSLAGSEENPELKRAFQDALKRVQAARVETKPGIAPEAIAAEKAHPPEKG